MSNLLVFNSKNIVGNNNNTFQYNFSTPLEIGLGSQLSLAQITLPYSWYNISSQIGNNVITYWMPTSLTTTTTFFAIINNYLYIYTGASFAFPYTGTLAFSTTSFVQSPLLGNLTISASNLVVGTVNAYQLGSGYSNVGTQVQSATITSASIGLSSIPFTATVIPVIGQFVVQSVFNIILPGTYITSVSGSVSPWTIALSAATTAIGSNQIVTTWTGFNSANFTAYQNNSVTFPNGQYQLNDLNNYLQSDFRNKGYYWYNPYMIGGNTFLLPQTTPQIFYPFSLSIYVPQYTNQITTTTIPLSAAIATVFGNNFLKADGANGQTTWPNYPLTANLLALVQIPLTTSSTSTIGNFLGYTQGVYPTQLTSTALSVSTLGNSSLAQPAFPPLGSTVNGVLVRCNLANNSVCIPSDVIDGFPLLSTFGSNINYLPISDNWIKIFPGKYKSIIISLCDQNFNPLLCNDPNILINILISQPDKK